MSSMAQKQLVRTEVSEFKFKNPQISVEKSVEYMKKLTVVAVSSILYVREIFPYGAFSERKIDDLKIKVLKGVDEIPGSKTMIEWVKSALTAVESHVLRKLVIVIEKGEETEGVMEAYTFNFDYNRDMIHCYVEDDNEKINVQLDKVPVNIKKSTRTLIRTILMTTQHMTPLPDSAQISMRLEFNDFVPEDYEIPQHFKVTDSIGLNFLVKPENLMLGKVETRFTSIAVSSKFIVSEEGDDEYCSQPEPKNNYSFTNNSLRITQQEKIDNMEVEASNLSETLSSVRLKGEVKCICDCDDVMDDNLQCKSCANYQHRACYKMMAGQTIDRHICVNCHDGGNPAKICTVPELVDDTNKKEGALYRRALVLCLGSTRVSPNTFMSQLHTSRQVAQQIYNRLEIDGCLQPPSGRGKNRIVNIDNIKDNILSLHFNDAKEVGNDIAGMETEENPILHHIESSSDKRRKRNKGEDNEHDEHLGLEGKRMKYTVTKNKLPNARNFIN